jgi:anti-sigma factor RsiW
MTDRDPLVTEADLHAYVDGEVSADRCAVIEAWLATHPDDAARVAQWRGQADAIGARYGAIATERVPARLHLDKIVRGGRSWRGVAAAAALVAFLIGGIAGWLAHHASAAAPSAIDVATADALSAYRLYTTEVRHPIEVRANEQHLLPWLSRRVGTSLHAPDLETFSLKLLGGRLLPGPVGPAALFMYESPSGERYTFYASRAKAPRSALRYHAEDSAAAALWVDGEVSYVVSGPADRERLMRIAQSAYEQQTAFQQIAPPTRSSRNQQLLSRRGS